MVQIIQNWRNKVIVRLISNQKSKIKLYTSKPSYMLQKIFDNDIVAMHKSKVSLKLNKPAYVRRCILDLSEVLIYEFHYDYIKNKYSKYSRL